MQVMVPALDVLRNSVLVARQRKDKGRHLRFSRDEAKGFEFTLRASISLRYDLYFAPVRLRLRRRHSHPYPHRLLARHFYRRARI